jgi:serine/threonine protein kinase/Tfp pilus assembly protein PilF
MSSSESRSAVVLALAEEFLARYRKGQRPALKEYIDRHPDLADEIREVFPAMAMMENIAVRDESLAGEPTGDASPRPIANLVRLGDFRIIRKIGHGGMGVVYEAEQVSLGRHVALKVLPLVMIRDANQLRRFEREARAAAKLHHTNIVPVFGVGEQDGTPYFVMQFIPGLGLNEVIDELRRLGARAGDGAHTPPNDPLPLTRDNPAAFEVAQSLLSGRFAPDRPADSTPGVTAAESPAFTDPATSIARTDADPELRPRTPASGHPAFGSELRRAAGLPTPTSSPFLSGHALKRGSHSARPATYWQSVAQIGIQVADALDYAHRQGVLHRDIKPSNLLLDTRGTVWVTDFGLAKADDERDLTATGDLLGTVRYMPPEAFEGRADARSDLYSLGLTLYELLALRPAFEEKDRNKLIKRVTTEDSPSLRALNPDVPRDLETIVHKAIDRDPARRYASAGELAADLQRFLDDEPIKARPASSTERFVRWCRRNPTIATMAGSLAAILTAGILVSSWQAIRATRAERAATQERDRAILAEVAATRERNHAQAEQARADQQAAIANAVNDFLQNDLLASASAETQLPTGSGADPDLKVRTVLDRAAARISGRFIEEPRVEASIQLTIGRAYNALGLYAKSQAHCERALELLVRTHGDQNQEVVELLTFLGWLHQAQGQFAQAETQLRRALQIGEGSLGQENIATVGALEGLGLLAFGRAQYAEAEPLLKRSAEVFTRTLGDRNFHTIQAMLGLALLYQQQGRYSLAQPLFERSLKASRDLLGDEHPTTLYATDSLAGLLQVQGHLKRALAMLSRSLEIRRRSQGDEHPATLGAMVNLAALCHQEGDRARAADLLGRALEIGRRTLGEKHPTTVAAMQSRGWLYRDQGQFDEAEPLLVRALDLNRSILGQRHPQTLSAVHSLAFLYLERGRLDDAEPLFTTTLKCRQEILGESHPLTLASMTDLATLYRIRRRFAPAEALLSRALDLSRRARGDAHHQTSWIASNLAWLLIVSNAHGPRDPARAVALAQEANSHAPNSRTAGIFSAILGAAYYRAGAWQKAAAALERSEELGQLGQCRDGEFFLAMAYWRRGHCDLARDWLDRAICCTEEGGARCPESRFLRAEAEALIVFDPAFPDLPFAP